MVSREATTTLRPAFDPSPAAEVTYQLRVIDGPDTGKSFTLDGSQPSRVLVGQSVACDFRLSDPSVSRRHFALDVRGDALRITDLESKNGTIVNGVTIFDAELRGQAEIRIGDTCLRVDRQSSSTPPQPPAATSFGRMIGMSTEMRRLYPLCERLAASKVPVVIEGETGTGKEILAESLHETGPRARAPFIVFDCTAVASTLMESELFGHERGAFTGAVGSRKGLFEEAHGGTLLIDEIGDLELGLQSKLLRVIERSEMRRVGGNRSIQVDVRVIAATRRNLDREVQEGRFRDDLFHRLAVARIELPPLRERRGDIPVLARRFAAEYAPEARLPSDVLMRWNAHHWLGNVRELRNAVARFLALGELADVALGSSSKATSYVLTVPALPFAEARRQIIEEFEQRYLERVLAEHSGNLSQAARASGVSRRYLQMIKSKKV